MPHKKRDRQIGRRIGAAIAAGRRARGWTQAQMAEVLEISANHAGFLERGERLPSLATLLGIAEALNLSLDVVFLGRPDGRLAIRDELADLVATVPDEARPIVLEFVRAGVAALNKRGRAPR